MFSAFPQLVLVLWIPVTVLFFVKAPSDRAVVLTILYGYLFLPEKVGINLPILPTLDKYSIPAILAFICVVLTEKRTNARELRKARQEGKRRSPQEVSRSRVHVVVNLIGILLIASCVLTFWANRTPIIEGAIYIPGLRVYDLMALIQNTMFFVLPLWLAKSVIKTRDGQVFLLQAIAIAGLIYTLPILLEARLSPQLNRWIYGFHAHYFDQHIRGGQFRAMVFLGHGLRVGIFIAMATLAAAALYRLEKDKRRKMLWFFAVVWLLPVLYLSRNVGALALTLLFLPLVMLLGARLQIIFAAIVSLIILAYPLARGSGIIPTDRIAAAFEQINPNRARSLNFRLQNEDKLLEKANVKPVSGWGIWGRNNLYDPKTGRKTSISDGIWVIVIGIRGWLGYTFIFGLLALPPVLLAMRRGKDIGMLEAGLCMILTVNLVDLIPNSSLTPLTWMIGGALWGRLAWSKVREAPSTDAKRKPSKPPKRQRIRTSSSRPRSSIAT